MYIFYLGEIQLPVAPSKMEMKIKNQNKTINLINDGEINLLKSPGLTEISFDALIPQNSYPFANYPYNGFVKAEYFLEEFENMKTSLEPFRFVVWRHRPNPITSKNGAYSEYNELFDTNMMVTLEDYTIKDDTAEGFDIVVSIKLKQYRSYSTKTISLQELENGKFNAIVNPVREDYSKVTLPTYYEAQRGDTFWGVAKKFYGNGSYYRKIYDANADRLGLVTTAYMPYNTQVNFDAMFYARNNPDVVAVCGTDPDALYAHYLAHGKDEGRLGASPYDEKIDYKYYIPAL